MILITQRRSCHNVVTPLYFVLPRQEITLFSWQLLWIVIVGMVLLVVPIPSTQSYAFVPNTIVRSFMTTTSSTTSTFNHYHHHHGPWSFRTTNQYIHHRNSRRRRNDHSHTPRHGNTLTLTTTTTSDMDSSSSSSSLPTTTRSNTATDVVKEAEDDPTTTTSTTIPMRDLYTNVAVLDPQWFHEYIVHLLHDDDDDDDTMEHVSNHHNRDHDDIMIDTNFWQRVKELRNTILYQPEIEPSSSSSSTYASITMNENMDEIIPTTTTTLSSTADTTEAMMIVAPTSTVEEEKEEEKVDTTNGQQEDDTTILQQHQVSDTSDTNWNIPSTIPTTVMDDDEEEQEEDPQFMYVAPATDTTTTTSILSSSFVDTVISSNHELYVLDTTVLDMESIAPEMISGFNNTNLTKVRNATKSTTATGSADNENNDVPLDQPLELVAPTTATSTTTPLIELKETSLFDSMKDCDDDVDSSTESNSCDNVTLTGNVLSEEPQRVVLYSYQDDDDDDDLESTTTTASSGSLIWKQVPLTVLQELGYNETDVIHLLPMALHIIITDQIRKPQRPVGIPSRWLRTDSSNTFGVGNEEEEEQMIQIVNEAFVEEILQTKMSSVSSTAKQSAAEQRSPVTQPSMPFVPQRQPSSPISSSNVSSVMADPTTTKNINSTPNAVMPSTTKTMIPNATTDVTKNEPSRTFIAGPETRASLQGTPYVNEISKKVATTRTRESTRVVPDESLPPRRSTDKNNNMNRDEASVSPSTERRRRRPPPEAVNGSSSSSSPQSRERAVYNGRSPTRTKRRDTYMSDVPAPPKSFLWPDVDTFQKLLRDEATFRLRILGNDWTDVVKEEIDWRNDLYTSWLHTLQNGIGEPFVQSRSDRLRRQRQQQEERIRRDKKAKSATKRSK